MLALPHVETTAADGDEQRRKRLQLAEGVPEVGARVRLTPTFLDLIKPAAAKWARSRYAYVQFEMGDRTYMVAGLGGLVWEEMCELLAERVERDHPGLGQKAYEAAREQLETKDFDAEWRELMRKIHLCQLWGGPVPAAVILPDEGDPEKWNVVIPDPRTGMPVTYRAREKVLNSIMPSPTEENAVKGEFGWEVKQKYPALRKLRRVIKERKDG